MSADPSLLRVVDEQSPTAVTITGPLVHLCPHVPEVDAGTAELAWVCDGATVELHTLAAYLASWSDQAISHEELTEQIRADLSALEGIEHVRVVTRWRTAGMAVTVAAAAGR